MKRFTLSMVAVLFATAMLAGCGGTGGTSTSTPSGGITPSDQPSNLQGTWSGRCADESGTIAGDLSIAVDIAGNITGTLRQASGNTMVVSGAFGLNSSFSSNQMNMVFTAPSGTVTTAWTIVANSRVDILDIPVNTYQNYVRIGQAQITIQRVD